MRRRGRAPHLVVLERPSSPAARLGPERVAAPQPVTTMATLVPRLAVNPAVRAQSPVASRLLPPPGGVVHHVDSQAGWPRGALRCWSLWTIRLAGTFILGTDGEWGASAETFVITALLGARPAASSLRSCTSTYWVGLVSVPAGRVSCRHIVPTPPSPIERAIGAAMRAVSGCVIPRPAGAPWQFRVIQAVTEDESQADIIAVTTLTPLGLSNAFRSSTTGLRH